MKEEEYEEKKKNWLYRWGYHEGYINGLNKASEIFRKVIKEKFEKYRGKIE